MLRTCVLALVAVGGQAEDNASWAPRSIESIFKESGTDKFSTHGYHRFYESELLPFRDLGSVRVMEIGANNGESMVAWLKYFRDPAIVVGVAYQVDASKSKRTACSAVPTQCARVDIVSMDQSNKTALQEFKRKFPEGWDIIIDDGSHVPEHMLISFEALWPTIRPGGLYVLEDIETSYWPNNQLYGYTIRAGIGKPPPSNVVEQFKQFVDVVSRKHMGQYDFSVMHDLDQDIARITFGDGIIFVQKAPADPAWSQFPLKSVMLGRTRFTAGPLQEYLHKIGQQQGSVEQNVPEAGSAQARARYTGERDRAQDLRGGIGWQCTGLFCQCQGMLCQMVVVQVLSCVNLLIGLLAWKLCVGACASSEYLAVASRDACGAGNAKAVGKADWHDAHDEEEIAPIVRSFC